MAIVRKRDAPNTFFLHIINIVYVKVSAAVYVHFAIYVDITQVMHLLFQTTLMSGIMPLQALSFSGSLLRLFWDHDFLNLDLKHRYILSFFVCHTQSCHFVYRSFFFFFIRIIIFVCKIGINFRFRL